VEFTRDLSDTIHLGSGFDGRFISMRISVATKFAGLSSSCAAMHVASIFKSSLKITDQRVVKTGAVREAVGNF